MSDSLITKNAIAAALKALCKGKAFEKISIADITTECGLNRQTFYYHFQDKYELLSWMYYHENFEKITEGISLDNWDRKILQMLEIMEADKSFYTNTIKEPEHTFESYLFELTKALFSEAIPKLNPDGKLKDEELEFDAEFYAYGICGVIVSWTVSGMKRKPEDVVGRLKNLSKYTERIGFLRSQVVS